MEIFALIADITEKCAIVTYRKNVSKIKMAEWGDSVSSSSPLADSEDPPESTKVVTSSGGRPASKKNSRMGLREQAMTKKHRRPSDSSEASTSRRLLIPRPRPKGSGDQQFISIKEVNEDAVPQKQSPLVDGGGFEETPRAANDRVKKQLVAEEQKKELEARGPSKCCLLL